MEDIKEQNMIAHKKRKRHRKKQLFNTILKQMEFYFSDAALSKDRLLSQLVEKDPYVPLELFLTFNKIKALTHKTSDIAAALKSSTFLEISDDHTKVKRINPLVPYDVDPRTIYVESIPYTATIEWINQIFQIYGPVAYVSLPRYFKSNRIKGFAFVEFVHEEDAKKCLEAFTEMGCKMPTNIKVETLASCQGYQPDVPDPNAPCDDERRDVIEEKQDDKEEPPRKKPKKDTEEGGGGEYNDGISKNNIAEESATEHSESANEQENTRLDLSTNANPTRKRKNKDKKKASKDREKKNINISAKNLQILSKCEWKKLRNKYLEMQRKHMKALKKVLKTQHTLPGNRIPGNNAGVAFSHGDDCDTNKNNKKLSEIAFVEGVIAKVQLEEPCLNVKEFKRATKQNVNVDFVDVKESESVAFIRLKNPQTAKEFLTSGIFPDIKILTGTEEKDYWELIKKHQYEKANSKRKIRGRDRLVNKATQLMESINKNVVYTNKHFRFDE